MNEPIAPTAEEYPGLLLKRRLDELESSNTYDRECITRAEEQITEARAGIERRNEVIVALRAALAKLEG